MSFLEKRRFPGRIGDYARIVPAWPGRPEGMA